LYTIAPYYQNFNGYLKSEVIEELNGEPMTDELKALRYKKCTAAMTRETPDGDDIVPCGMKAVSVFNDTFEVQGRTIRRKGIAWASDVERYHNPDDYLNRSTTSWLYERYPDVATQDEGVNSEPFALWMRPAALNRVWNVYGMIDDDIPAGNLTITIHNRYPTHAMNVTKSIVLTSVGVMGGRHNGLGYVWMISGVGLMFMSLIIGSVKVCLKRILAGRGMQLDSDSNESDQSGDGGSGH